MQLLERALTAPWGRALLQRLGNLTAAKGKREIPAQANSWLILGHSHIHALIDAQTSRVTTNRSSGEFAFINMLDETFYPNVLPRDGALALNPALVHRIQEAITALGGNPVIIDCVSGNEYHFFGLVQHARPFDFVLPSAPDLSLEPGAEVIPSTLMTATMRHAMEYALAILTALRTTTILPIWHVQSPPPIRSQAHIVAHPTQFKDAIDQYGVSPAMLRWKLWQLQSEIYQEACAAAGVNFLPTPSTALDPEGFLLEAGWNPDPTHANSWYGELVLAQICALPAFEADA